MATLKDNIKDLLAVISKQYLEQINMKVALNSKRNTLDEEIASGIKGREQELEKVENHLEVLRLSRKDVSKAKDRIHALLDRLDSEIEYTRTQEITDGDKIIYEDKYQINGEISVTRRTLIEDGRTYIFQKVVFGDEKEPYATVKVGNENGEVTYREVNYAGTYELIKKRLAYDKVVDEKTGVERLVRNPKKDYTWTRNYIPEKGEIITSDEPICDEQGNLICSHHYYEETPPLEYRNRNIVEERKFIDKSGKEVIFRQEMSSVNDLELFRRTDFVNGEMTTQVLMTNYGGILAITNYRDGKKANWARYEMDGTRDLYSCWIIKKKKYYNETGIEIYEEELTEDEKIIPDGISPSHISSYEYKKLSLSQIIDPIFGLGGSYVSEEMQKLLDDSFFLHVNNTNYGFEVQDLEKLDIEELNNSQNKTH